MSVSSAAFSPLISLALPQSPARRLAASIVLAVVGSVLLAVSSKIQVPFYPVPMTMQSAVVLIIGAAFGWRLGVATLALYLLEGAMGFPVFAGTPPQVASPAYLVGPTGGYLLGFLLSAGFVGWCAEKGWDRSLVKITAAMFVGHLIIFIPGALWLASFIGAEAAWLKGVAPFYLATLVKTALAGALMPACWWAVEKFRGSI